MINTVIFDVGGTLIGAPDLILELAKLFPRSISDTEVYDRIKRVFLNHYLSTGNELVEFENIENIIRRTLEIVSKHYGCEDKSIYAKACYYNTFVSQSFLYEDTLHILDHLKKKGIKLIVASDADAELLYDEFKMHKLEKYFDKCFISSDIKAYKPSNKFVKALKDEVIEPLDKIIIVGDSIVDIVTGEKLGIKTVFKGEAAEKKVTPNYSIRHLKELIEIIG